jgi:outer membrane protein
MKRSWIVFFLFFSFGSLSAQQELTVEQAIALALNKNFDIQLAQNTTESAATNDKYSIGAFLPTLNANASIVRNANHQRVAYSGVRDTLNSEGRAEAVNTLASVQLNWVLFDGAKMFIARNRLETLDEQAQLNLKSQMVNTIASVILSYHDIVRQKQQLKAVEEQLAVSDERVKLATRKLDVGSGAKPELLQAKVDYNAFKTLSIQQQASIRQLKEQLNNLTGLQLEAQYDVSDTIIIDLNLQRESIEEGIETKNFLLQSTRKNVEVAEYLVRERRGDFFPVISFTSAYNYNQARNIVLIDPLRPFFNLSDGYNYGLTASVPIFNGFTRKRELQQSKINLSRQWITFNQNRALVNVGVRNAFVAYTSAKEILLVEEETIVLARENVTIAFESFRRGVATFIELRTAQQSMAEAYNRLITARYNAKVAETELLRLNGSLLR